MTSAFEITDRYVDVLCEEFPLLATQLGVPGRHDEWGDGFGIEGHETRRRLAKDYRARLEPHLDDPDSRQRRAAKVTVGLIDEGLAADEAGDEYRDLRHLASSFGMFRSVFDVMPTETVGDWGNITSRLATIDKPFEDYIGRLDEGLRQGITVAKRQVRSVIAQARRLGGDESSFHGLSERAGTHRSDALETAIDHARSEATKFAAWLESTYLPDALDEDGVGEDHYRRAADRLVGMSIDPHEAYEWGWDEFHRLLEEMSRVGEQILPGQGFAEVKDFLETDPAGTVESTEELVAFVEVVLAEAVEDLAGKHFDVPGEIRPLTVQIAPPDRPLGAYYLGPSEDFSRHGGVWYSVGEQTVFPLYQHRSTAYHEGFPGHHLQIATAMHQKENLSRAQRVLTWYPGYGEGWAMYAEVLMGELGYLESAKSYFGMLAKQMYRASRIVVDIGLHLGKRISDSSPIEPGSPWRFETAVDFMEVYGFRTRQQAEAEVLRYLGWPGQAISYKLGEREILSIREDTWRRLGPDFDLRAFHAAVLENGAMRLDLLRETVDESL
jgi:uncharacterized protein (DUF885 family)